MKFSRKLTHAVVAIACFAWLFPRTILAAPTGCGSGHQGPRRSP